jgi:hypothetical protein
MYQTNENVMHDLRIILANVQQIRSQTVKTKIKRFLLRKRKIRNVGLFLNFDAPAVTYERTVKMFDEIKRDVIREMKQGKNIPVKY